MARNIYKRNDERYEARYIKGRDPNGRAVYRSLYAHSYAEVKSKLELAKSGLIPQRLKTTVAQAVLGYLDSAADHLKQSSISVYRGLLARHITPYFADMRCDRLTSEIMNTFVEAKTSCGLSSSTVKSAYSLIKAGVSKVYATCAAFDIKFPKNKTGKRGEAACLSVSEQRKLENAAQSSNDADYSILYLGLYTGARLGELSALTWDDIDILGKSLYIHRTMQRICSDGDTKTQIAFLSPKSESSTRHIPLPDFLVKILRDLKTKSNSEYVISRNGQFIEPRTVQNHFKKLLQRAGVRHVNFHTLRHTFATRALECGFDVKSLSEILGHASATVTLRTYAHALDGQRRRCMDSLSSVWYSNVESGQNSGQPGCKIA
jgi:site-specific recombinase XerD